MREMEVMEWERDERARNTIEHKRVELNRIVLVERNRVGVIESSEQCQDR
jgi:hypothetical protein